MYLKLPSLKPFVLRDVTKRQMFLGPCISIKSRTERCASIGSIRNTRPLFDQGPPVLLLQPQTTSPPTGSDNRGSKNGQKSRIQNNNRQKCTHTTKWPDDKVELLAAGRSKIPQQTQVDFFGLPGFPLQTLWRCSLCTSFS